MPDQTNTPEIELPKPACIVTNVGNDKPQSFMLALVHGVALANQPAGSTLSLYTAEQVRAAILADRSRRACQECGGIGEVLTHAEDCDDDLCALNGDMHSCGGLLVPCDCTADRSRLQVDQDARDAKRYQQFLRTSNEEFDRMRRLAQMHSGYGGKSISESLDEAISRAAMDAVKEPR